MRFKVGDKVKIVSNIDKLSGDIAEQMRLLGGKSGNITYVYARGRYKISQDSGKYVWCTEWLEPVEPSISLKLEGIEEGEKFNVFDSKGNIIKYSPYHIEGNRLFDCDNEDDYGARNGLLEGKFTIQKIDQKQEKIERIEQEMRKLADELKELKNG